jgi:hypothetical protein
MAGATDGDIRGKREAARREESALALTVEQQLRCWTLGRLNEMDAGGVARHEDFGDICNFGALASAFFKEQAQWPATNDKR